MSTFEKGLKGHESKVESIKELKERVGPERIISKTAPFNLDYLFLQSRGVDVNSKVSYSFSGGELLSQYEKVPKDKRTSEMYSPVYTEARTYKGEEICWPIATVDHEGRDLRFEEGWDSLTQLPEGGVRVNLTAEGGYTIEHPYSPDSRGGGAVRNFRVAEGGICVGLEYVSILEGRREATPLDLGVITGFDDKSGRLIVQKKNEQSGELEPVSPEEQQAVENYLQIAVATTARNQQRFEQEREKAGYVRPK
jgi:hypothetical protein